MVMQVPISVAVIAKLQLLIKTSEETMMNILLFKKCWELVKSTLKNPIKQNNPNPLQ